MSEQDKFSLIVGWTAVGFITLAIYFGSLTVAAMKVGFWSLILGSGLVTGLVYYFFIEFVTYMWTHGKSCHEYLVNLQTAIYRSDEVMDEFKKETEAFQTQMSRLNDNLLRMEKQICALDAYEVGKSTLDLKVASEKLMEKR